MPLYCGTCTSRGRATCSCRDYYSYMCANGKYCVLCTGQRQADDGGVSGPASLHSSGKGAGRDYPAEVSIASRVMRREGEERKPAARGNGPGSGAWTGEVCAKQAKAWKGLRVRILRKMISDECGEGVWGSVSWFRCPAVAKTSHVTTGLVLLLRGPSSPHGHADTRPGPAALSTAKRSRGKQSKH